MPPKRKNKTEVVVDSTTMTESSQVPANSQMNDKVHELEEQIRLLRLENSILRQKVEEKSSTDLNRSKVTRSNSIAQLSAINETQLPTQGAGTPVSKRIIKQVINSPINHAAKGCSCSGACANKKCGCVKKNMACNESCKCHNECANKHRTENEENKENQVINETNIVENENVRDQNVATQEKPTGATNKKEVKRPKEKKEKNNKNAARAGSDKVDAAENVEVTQKTSKTATAAPKSKKEKKSKKTATPSNDEDASQNDKTDQTEAVGNNQKPSTSKTTEESAETSDKKSAAAKQKKVANKNTVDKTNKASDKTNKAGDKPNVDDEEVADLIVPKEEPLTPGPESSVPPAIVKSMFDTPASNKSGPSPLAEAASISTNSSPEDDGIINPMKPRRQLPRSPVQSNRNNVTSANHTVNNTIITDDDMYLPIPRMEEEIEEEIPPPPELEKPEVDWEAHQATLVECQICKRKFYQHRVKKHEKSCKKI